VSGLKPDIFREEIASRACESLRRVISEAREELPTYREVLEITDRMKKADVKKSPNGTSATDSKKSEKPGNNGVSGATIGSFPKTAPTGKTGDAKDVEFNYVHKKGLYTNKCPELKAKETNEVFKVRIAEAEKETEATLRHIRIRYSDDQDGFLRYWILFLNIGEPGQGPTNEWHVARIFVDTGANCNTIDRSFYNNLLELGLQMEFISGPEEEMRANLQHI
jgi:hypothetical protein